MTAMKLGWLDALCEQLARDRPSGGAYILAVAAVLLRYANPDGTQANVGQRQIAAETVLYRQRVNEAHTWLVDHDWVKVEGFSRHRTHKRTLIVPVGSGGLPQGQTTNHPGGLPQGQTTNHPGGLSQGQTTTHDEGSSGPVSGPVSGLSQGQTEPPTTDPRPKGGGKVGQGRGADAAGASPHSPGGELLQPLPDAAVELLVAVAQLVPASDVDGNVEIRAGVLRLAEGGWTADQLWRAWRPNPEPIKSPDRFVIGRLRLLPPDPAESARLRAASSDGGGSEPTPPERKPDVATSTGEEVEPEPVEPTPTFACRLCGRDGWPSEESRDEHERSACLERPGGREAEEARQRRLAEWTAQRDAAARNADFAASLEALRSAGEEVNGS